MSDMNADLETAAREAVGNWLKFEAFGWYYTGNLGERKELAIFNIAHRDSGLLDQSNAAAIVSALTNADPDGKAWTEERHGHWAVGYVDAVVIRPIDTSGAVTDAFRAYHACTMRMADYPILDDAEYSDRQYDEGCESVLDTVRTFIGRGRLPDSTDAESTRDEIVKHMCEGSGFDVEDSGYVNERDVERACKALFSAFDAPEGDSATR